MMQGEDFLSIAGKLAAQPSFGVAGYRTAISRAYYGIFHLARRFLADFRMHCPRGANEHLWIQRLFRHCDAAEGVQIGVLLGSLHESRKAADYDLLNWDVENQANVQAAVMRATELANRIKTCSSGAIRNQIEQGMRAYRRQIKEE